MVQTDRPLVTMSRLDSVSMWKTAYRRLKVLNISTFGTIKYGFIANFSLDLTRQSCLAHGVAKRAVKKKPEETFDVGFREGSQVRFRFYCTNPRNTQTTTNRFRSHNNKTHFPFLT
jgi:hypothetical protein